MTREDLRGHYVTAYTDTFDESELGALVGFFRTHAGRRYVEQLQSLQPRAMEINERHAQRIEPAINAIANEMQTELDAK